MAQARSFYERALALDPSNIEALVGTAFVDVCFVSQFLNDNRRSRAAAAEAGIDLAPPTTPS
jgi:hypothetical protein